MNTYRFQTFSIKVELSVTKASEENNDYYWVPRCLDIYKITIILAIFNEDEQKFTLLIFTAAFYHAYLDQLLSPLFMAGMLRCCLPFHAYVSFNTG